jgi:phosphoserine phosphatase RsbU/P
LKVFRDSNQLLHSLPCACVVLDDNGIIEFANEYVYPLLGYTSGELLNQSQEIFLTISSRIFYQTHVFPLLRLNGEVKEIFLTLRAKNGDSVPVMVNGNRVTNDNVSSNVYVFFPVKERKKYEDELLNAKKVLQKAVEENETLNRYKHELEKHQLLLDRQISTLSQRNQEYVQMNKVLSHDMQEPLRKVEIFVDILSNQSTLQVKEELAVPFRKILEAVNHLKILTHCLQKFVSLDSNEEAVEVLHLKPLFEATWNEVLLTQGHTEMVLRIDSIPPIEGRAQLLKSLFKELLQNALQNKREGVPLQLTVKSMVVEVNIYQVNRDKYNYTDHLRIEITDNGKGFENKYASYIFGLFNKLERKSIGTGVGLALSKQIVSLHNGVISAKSSPGKGTTITLILPVIQPVL